MRKWLKVVLIAALLLVFLILATLLYLPSYIVKYVEKHDLELIGREVQLENIDINYLKGAVSIQGFVMKEKESLDDFLSFDALDFVIAYRPLFLNTIHLKANHLVGLKSRIVQNQRSFNFDDLLQTNSTEPSDSVENKWHVLLDNIEVSNSSLNYTSDLLPEPIQVDSIHIRIPWLSDTSDVILSDVKAHLTTGGTIELKNFLQLSTATYSSDVKTTDVEVRAFKPYLDPFLETTKLEGELQANFHVTGNWENSDDINFGGMLGLDAIEMENIRNERVLAIDHFEVEIDTVRMQEAIYNINTIRADGFYTIYELYDQGSNWDNMILTDSASLAESGRTTEDLSIDYSNPFQVLGNYLHEIAKSYQSSTYRVGHVLIENSSMDFNDFTPSIPFRYSLTNTKISAEALTSQSDKLRFDLSSTLNKTGDFNGYLNVYTHNLKDIDLYYKIEGTDLTVFSPYTSDFVDFPIAKGELLYECRVEIRDGILKSENILNCEKFDLGSSYDGNPLYKLPVKLAVSLLRDLDGNIHLDIPVEGDLNDPEYKLGKVIWQSVKNILLKAVSAPFRLLAGMFHVKEEDIKELRFGHLQREVKKQNKKQLNDLAKILKAKPELNIEFKRITKKFEEAERYAIAETKYEYLYKKPHPDLSEADADLIQELTDFDVKDSLFIQFVDKQIEEQDRALPIQRKCMLYVGEEKAIEMTDKIGHRRSTAISTYLKEEKEIPDDRYRFILLPPDSMISHRSDAIYRIGFYVDE